MTSDLARDQSDYLRALGLREGEDAIAFLRSVLAAIPAFIILISPDDKIRYINRIQPGLDLANVIGVDAFNFIAPQHHEVARGCFEAVRATSEPTQYEADAPGPNGQTAHYTNYVTPVPEPDGSVALCIVALDVTEQRKREQRLQENEEKLRLAIDATGIGLWSHDLVTDELVWNKQMRDIHGVDAPMRFEDYCAELIHPDDREERQREGLESFRTGVFPPATFRIVRPDGEVRWVITHGKFELDEAGQAVRVVGGHLDITSQKSIEEQLRRAQKMEAVGSLTAGVAHNFNNMLMVMLPSLDMLADITPESHEPILEDARMVGERAAEMVRQLMTFAGQRVSPKRADLVLGDLLDEILRMCRRTFERQIAIDLDNRCPATRVRANAGDLSQAVMNVLLNARDALLDAGTENARINIAIDQCDPNAVILCIDDNGPGMPDEVREQIFEPFFTTKLPKGTGLGLATCYAIVKELGGDVTCESVSGRGTRFEITLPTAVAEEDAEAAENEAAARSPRRVFVIDDEPAVQRVVERVLERESLTGVIASSVAEARKVLERETDFGLVLLDRSMPNVSGVAFVPELRRVLPDAKIFYFTGESFDAADDVDGVIEKPIMPKALAEKIRSAIDSP